MNLAASLARSAHAHASRVAVRLDEAALTYSALDEASRHVAGLLEQQGVRSGDRVGIMLPNVPQWAALYFGVLRVGAVVVPMNPLLKEREIAYYLGDSGAKLMFVWDAFQSEARAACGPGVECWAVNDAGFSSMLASAQPLGSVAERDGDDTAVILYTSGTTGQPKGAELTHANLDGNADVCVELTEVTADDVIFGGLPLFHVYGQTAGLNTAVRAGACLTLLPRFEPTAALEILARDKVSVFEGVPTMFVALLHHPHRSDYDLSPLRICVSGGAAIPVEVLTGFEEAFSCAVLEGYGLSETSPVASFNLPGRRRVGSIGTPVSGVELKIVDSEHNEVVPGEVGEIAIRGNNVMKGYWGKPEQTIEAIVDGWFHTGDLGRQDGDGFYYVVGRQKEVIIRGGYNVYPREIEDVLHEHPAVAEAAVIGVPHDELGEEVAAAVVLKPDMIVAADELRQFVKDKVAAYKYPRKLQFHDALPKGPTGKILKREITMRSTDAGT